MELVNNKIIYVFFTTTILIISGFFISELSEYLGTIRSSKEIKVSVSNIETNHSEEEFEISITFVLINPTKYSKIQLNSIYFKIFLKTDGEEKFVGDCTYFARKKILPDNKSYFSKTLTVQNPEIKNFLTNTLLSELNWRIYGFTHFETPLKRFYHTFEFNLTSLNTQNNFN
jgi:hypothetical protein